MIEFDKDKKCVHDKLDKEESIIFCRFLLQESQRHFDDIMDINKTVLYLKEKHDIKEIGTVSLEVGYKLT